GHEPLGWHRPRQDSRRRRRSAGHTADGVRRSRALGWQGQQPNRRRAGERVPVTMSEWVRLLRVHQWTKNLLIAVPLVTAHRLMDLAAAANAAIAIVAFSFCASAAYVINDQADLEADRGHPVKRGRPLAS